MSRLPVALACLLLAACAAAPVEAAPASLSLPRVRSVEVLAEATMYTSPDGGIYQNPDRVSVVMVSRVGIAGVAALLPQAAAGWAPLRPLGPFTFVGLAVRNDGEAGSDLQLDVAQVASDFAPAAGDRGSLRHWYHPMFPLALLAAHPTDSTCAVHVDPGHTAYAVLVYPPIQVVPSIVWGVYDDVAVRAALGGGIPTSAGRLVGSACLPPEAPAAA